VSAIVDDELAAAEALAAAQPEAPGALSALGGVRAARGDLPGAIAAYEGAVAAADRQAAIARLNLGAAHAASGAIEPAIAAYRGALALWPDWLPALDHLASIELAAGRLDDAAATCDAALAIAPAHAVAHFTRGLVHAARGELTDAVARHRAACAAAPDHAAMAFALGAALAAHGDLDDAAAAYRAACALDPRSAEAALSLALTELARRDADAATAAADAACALAPTDASAASALGAAHTLGGRRAEARTAYLRARELAPELADLHHNCALAAEAVEDFDAAIDHERDALARAPRHFPALVNLSRLLVDHRRLDELGPVYQQLAAVAPDNQMTTHLLTALRGEVTAAAPRGYVVTLFDALAPRFDTLLVDTLHYRGHRAVADAVIELAAGRTLGAALDLGCGTGLVGAGLHAHVGHLTGVDLAPRMLDAARARGCYHALVERELTEHLAAVAPASLDVITAADVLIYLGELAPMIAAAAAALVDGGALAVTVERSDDAPIALRPTGRYAHHRDYLAGLAATHGFAVRTMTELTVRREAGAEVAAWLAVLIRSPRAA
jgi:predicted TPR repeat methyltransferase